jgi:hypothetical protein
MRGFEWPEEVLLPFLCSCFTSSHSVCKGDVGTIRTEMLQKHGYDMTNMEKMRDHVEPKVAFHLVGLGYNHSTSPSTSLLTSHQPGSMQLPLW